MRACLLTLLLLLAAPLLAAPIPSTHTDDTPGHARVLVLSDIGNEPDDQMSLVRLLLYSNDIDIEGLIAVTSTWQKNITHPDIMHKVIDAYSKVQPNLLLHSPAYPAAGTLHQLVFSGQPAYGMAATGPGQLSPGARQIIAAADAGLARHDPRPLWISVWGGTNTLAQALLEVRSTRTPAQLSAFTAQLRVYSISDQDDAGPWIRREFPDLFYIVQPSTQSGDEYAWATWTGISGDRYYRNGDGADFTTVTNGWLDTNIRSKGPLGAAYPRFLFIMEGDTPSWLNLIPNGLAAAERPDYGGWGGRYIYRQPHGETHPFWTQGGDEFFRTTSQDTVTGTDGREHTSDQATIWRWRNAFQNDFAARMNWTIRDYAHANHPPIAVVNNTTGIAPIHIDATAGASITLDATASHDPDPGQHLHYHWFVYNEAGSTDPLGTIALTGTKSVKATVTATNTCRAPWINLPILAACPATASAHIILAVTDDGTPTLTSYRRIILTIQRK